MKSFKLPSLHLDNDTYETWYTLCDKDGNLFTKKVLKVVEPVDDKPMVVIFTDHTFTVGKQPVVYSKEGDNWIVQFSFVSIETTQIKSKQTIEFDDDLGGIMQWIENRQTTIGLPLKNMATTKKKE